MVSDELITKYQQTFGTKRWCFCEPACAVSIAGVVDMAKEYQFKSSDKIVSIITGQGLKDPDQAIKVSVQPEVVEANYKAVSDSIFSTH